MAMNFDETSIHVQPHALVEFLIDVDGRAVRVALGWPLVESLMGAVPGSEDQVRDFIRRNRDALTTAFAAHVLARGVPLDRYLVMSSDDIDAILSTRHASFESGAR